jgi:hypothetical protein
MGNTFVTCPGRTTSRRHLSLIQPRPWAEKLPLASDVAVMAPLMSGHAVRMTTFARGFPSRAVIRPSSWVPGSHADAKIAAQSTSERRTVCATVLRWTSRLMWTMLQGSVASGRPTFASAERGRGRLALARGRALLARRTRLQAADARGIAPVAWRFARGRQRTTSAAESLLSGKHPSAAAHGSMGRPPLAAARR